MLAKPIFADRSEGIPVSATMQLTARVRSLRAEGVKVISFAAGEPHFEPPPFLYEAVQSGLKKEFTKYTPVPGLPDVRQSVSNWVNKRYTLERGPETVVLTTGAKGALHNVFQVLLNAGDEVVYPSPYWVSYPSMIHISEGVSKVIPTTVETRLKMTPDMLRSAITPKTKLFLFNSPNNPTGVAYTQAEIDALAEVLAEFPHVWVVSDDIYDSVLWQPDQRAHFCFSKKLDSSRLIIIQGLSKSHAVTGWRIGYLCAPKDVAARVSLVMGHCQSAVPTFSQLALKAAYEHNDDFLKAWVAYYENNMRQALPILKEQWGTPFVEPDGAFYMFPEVGQLYPKLSEKWGLNIQDDVAFCEAVLEKLRVGFVPGSAFGSKDHIRITTAMSSENFLEGLMRVGESLK